LDEIITHTNEVLGDLESDKAVGVRTLANPTAKTAESYVIVKQNAGSSLFTVELEAKNSDL